MITAIVQLHSIAPYSQGRYCTAPIQEGEDLHAREERIWRERLHYDEKGIVYIPQMAFQLSLISGAQHANKRVKGEGQRTWTKIFESGILVSDNLSIGIHKDDVQGVWRLLPADGKRGGSKKVEKCMSVIPQWSGEVTYHIIDPKITFNVFVDMLLAAGQFIGIGVFRPEKRGFFGRYTFDPARDIRWLINGVDCTAEARRVKSGVQPKSHSAKGN